MKKDLENILKQFVKKNILVIGDVMLDEYIYGTVDKISQEASIPIHREEKREYLLGGAGNTASNIASLGGKVIVFGFIGNDKEGEIVKKLLSDKQILSRLDNNLITTRKTRLIGERNQQIFRTDNEDSSKKTFSKDSLNCLLSYAESCDMIIISDYAKGTITPDLVNLLAHNKDKMIVDPKPKNKLLYQKMFLIKPNIKEINEMTGLNDFKKAGCKLRKELDSNILLTLGENGFALFSKKECKQKIQNIPTYAREVYDVSGAGDTVIATLSLALSSGANLEQAAILANYAAGIAVEKKGTYSVNLSELEFRVLFEEEKIVNLEQLKKIIPYHKSNKRKIVWTNGCYDILHAGHKSTLLKAKEEGDILILGLDSDESIKNLNKGENRPINNEQDRADLLASMNFIDYISIYNQGGVFEYLKELKPEIYFKGGDYTLETINQKERKLIEDYGGKIIFGPKLDGKSTTNTIERIKQGRED